jgi:hypothetical protein
MNVMGTLSFMKKFSIAIFGGLAIALGTIESATAGLNFISTQTGQVGTIDTSTGAFTQLASGPFMYDIALSNDDRLFGSDAYNLVDISPTSSKFSTIGNFGAFINGLGFASNNTLYGTGSSGFYEVNTLTGAATLIANIAGFNSSGDIAYDVANNRFLATSAGDSLWSIALNGSATKIGNIGFGQVYGLLFDQKTVYQKTLYGYTGGQQIAINTTTGEGTFSKNVTGVNGWIGGGASAVPEPTTVLGSLLGMGILGSVRSRYKRQKQQKQ